MATFLLKTEPGEFSFDDLERAGRATWDGVTNNAALIHMRAIRRGDEVLIYHTGDVRAIVGLAAVTSDPRPDPLAGDPKIVVFDIEPRKRAKTAVTLAAIKADPRFATFDLVRQGRLSVMAVPPDLDALLRKLAGL